MTPIEPMRPGTGAPRPGVRTMSACAWVASLIFTCATSVAPAQASDPPAKPADARAASTDAAAVDRLQLDATSITGNRELPKVMSIVPWKAAEPPAGPDRPMGSLIEELLTPLDRDEFRREIAYHRDLSSRSAPVAPNVSVPGVSQP
jgi:hypothetical protein